MTWTPIVTVTIDGTDFTGSTVDTVQLRRGRQNVYTTVQAGVASVTLLDTDGTGNVPTVADPIVITLKDTAGIPVTLFVGEVSDWSTTIYDAGIKNSAAAKTKITAVSNLAKLQRRQVFPTGRPVEKDGERVFEILLDGLGSKWEDLVGTWNDLGNATWQELDAAIDFNIVDTPGLFDVISLDPQDGGYNAGQTAGDAGLSAGGLLFETADGRIGYADGLRRFTNANAGYMQIPAGVLSSSQVTSSQQIAELANVVTVDYAGGEKTVTDPASIEQFGRLTQKLSTVLENETDAAQRAQAYLEAHSAPAISFESASIRLEQEITDTLRDNLLALEVNDAVEIDELPATLGVTTFAGFVEGVVYTIDPFRANIELQLSSANLSLGPLFWAALPEVAWQDLPADLQWQNLGSL